MWLLQLSAIQIVLAVISLLIILASVRRFIRRERGQSLFKLLVSLGIWGAVLVFSLWPNVPRLVSVQFGLGDNLNTLIFFGFVILTLISFKLLSIIERLEHSLSDLVRHAALTDLRRQRDARK